ncbi:ABC transporter substrate-binding protein [Actinomadura rubrisoli]|uniref:ABC transporter substrate-binding protein n=1 Tax=Actinomadura rubrisoli TaxID=2530368 RepID=A0A4R5B9S3_9ACTN|nr:ABC transporter substrate-binding protein [Actinomadura rubrisoli]TDD80464.1 ABC transporter substrate-binding protein [Actinomadura rubrisoli]
MAIVALLISLIPALSWAVPRRSCRPGLAPSGDVWSKGGECVGISEGEYAFNRPELRSVMRKLAAQNADAHDGSCGKRSRAVTVGALMTLTSRDAGGRAVHLLEGVVAAQARANQDKSGCIHPVRVQVGQMGADEQAATSVAKRMSDDVVAVVGMGLSDQRTADAAKVFADRRIPMIGDVITAEGFDKNGSKDDRPDFGGCSDANYKDGVGQGFFYRVAFRNGVQVEQLAQYFKSGRFNFIMTPTTTDDPYTCTTLPLLHRRFGNAQEVRFDPSDGGTVKQSAQRICNSKGAVNVFYAARARDLPRFLQTVADESANGQCQFSNITVASTSDAARMRAQETDPSVESQRWKALNSTTFKEGKVRLVYSTLADPDVLARTRSTAFGQLRKTFTDLGFQATHLDAGWAVNGHDGMFTIAAALNTVSAGQKVTPTQVNTAIGGFARGGRSVAAAGGNITFDNNGNRDDTSPVVVQLCPVKDARSPITHTAQVHPATTRCP